MNRGVGEGEQLTVLRCCGYSALAAAPQQLRLPRTDQ